MNENIVIDSKGITPVLLGSKNKGKSDMFFIIPNQKAFQVILRGKGYISAKVHIMASLLKDSETFLIINKMTLHGVDIDSEGFVSDTPLKYFMIDVVFLSGNNASIDVLVGI